MFDFDQEKDSDNLSFILFLLLLLLIFLLFLLFWPSFKHKKNSSSKNKSRATQVALQEQALEKPVLKEQQVVEEMKVLEEPIVQPYHQKLKKLLLLFLNQL
ncbi:hypothetical protein AXA84_0449 [Candidatus Phytoplasma oryzae]|uniref:Uncharacterized protein n=1 Tax=Candidatus Phytoplasma oryzae TaxID=203274 RepID=A0A139JPY5_9MOLU|nr:hypothetical protein [Candidatus Phytoplasma oryzae]KXT29035.1 hypothetical protein AXA84_0449 [Candidatus Phytoplasma oryzae]